MTAQPKLDLEQGILDCALRAAKTSKADIPNFAAIVNLVHTRKQFIQDALEYDPPTPSVTDSFRAAAKKVQDALGLTFVETPPDLRAAAQSVAKSLRLNFLDNPSDDVIPGPSDLLYKTIDFNPATPVRSLGGAMTTMGAVGDEFAIQQTNRFLARASSAAVTVMEARDIDSASPAIQAMVARISDTSAPQYQGLDLASLHVAKTESAPTPSIGGALNARRSSATQPAASPPAPKQP